MADSYNGVPVPRDGERITYKDGRIQVPARPIIPFIEGDGTGRDIWKASVRVFDAAVQKAYAGKREVPIFSSRLVVPVIYINDLPELLKEGSAFRRYLAETKLPFAILINYGAANFAAAADAQAAWKLLNGELRDQFLGWISGESVGNVWDEAPRYLKLDPAMTRPQMLAALHQFYSDALARKWSAMFKTPSGPMWDRMLPAQSTSSTSYAHALSEWGVRFLGIETSAVQPMTAGFVGVGAPPGQSVASEVESREISVLFATPTLPLPQLGLLCERPWPGRSTTYTSQPSATK